MRLRVGHQHSWFFFDSGPFHALLHTVLGSQSDFQRLTIPGVRLRVHRQHSQFWPILTRFVDYYSPFCGPEAISIVVEPQVVVMCRSSTLAVLADSGPFHGLLLTILGSEVISMINEPWGAFTCWSSTLVVFVDSGPFGALLLTVLGSQSDFHD